MSRQYPEMPLPRVPTGFQHFSEYDSKTKQIRDFETHRPLVLPADAERHGEECALWALRTIWPCSDCEARGFHYVYVRTDPETGHEHEPQDCEACDGFGFDESQMPDGAMDKLFPRPSTGAAS